MPKKTSTVDFEYDEDTGDLELRDVEQDDEDEIDWGYDEEETSKSKSRKQDDDDDEEEESEDDEDESDDEEDDEEEESGEEDEDEVETPKTAVRGLSKRMDSFEKNLPNLIAAAVKAAVGGKEKDEDEEEEDDDDDIPEELDSKSLVKVLSKRIAKTVDQAVDGKLKKFAPAMEEAEVNRVWRKAMQTHGDSFVKNMPALARLMLVTGIEDPNKAWAGFKQLRPEQRKKLRVDAQKAQTKIARRKVDSDSEDTVTKRPERTPFKKLKGSDSDVFDAAFGSSVKTAIKKRRSGG